jgi:4-amino-4-deoxy-L-arabinose transferase-like glycosyltransferase
VVVAILAGRLFGGPIGGLAGLLLAFEPFLVAHARVFDTDSLLAGLMAVAILAALIAFDADGGWPYLLGSGLAAGLALLTKAPAVLLVGLVPMMGATSAWRNGRRTGADLQRLIGALLPWALVALAVYVVLWPALWVDPLGTLDRMVGAVGGVGSTPRRWGNYFLGQPLADDAGPLFYPIATLLRLSPITLVGLVLAGLLGPRWVAMAGERDWRPRAAALLDAVVLFVVLMSLSAKKLDRYALPIYPLLAILAAIGLTLALRRWVRPGRRWVALAALGLAQAALVVSVQPYPLSFFDPLLGGAPLARQAVVVGWGEGTDQVAAWLNSQPDADHLVASTLYNDLLNPVAHGSAVPLWEWQQADYFVDYVNMEQRQIGPALRRALAERGPPLETVWINGIVYARVYRIPPELKARNDLSEGLRGLSVPRP